MPPIIVYVRRSFSSRVTTERVDKPKNKGCWFSFLYETMSRLCSPPKHVFAIVYYHRPNMVEVIVQK